MIFLKKIRGEIPRRTFGRKSCRNFLEEMSQEFLKKSLHEVYQKSLPSIIFSSRRFEDFQFKQICFANIILVSHRFSKQPKKKVGRQIVVSGWRNSTGTTEKTMHKSLAEILQKFVKTFIQESRDGISNRWKYSENW